MAQAGTVSGRKTGNQDSGQKISGEDGRIHLQSVNWTAKTFQADKAEHIGRAWIIADDKHGPGREKVRRHTVRRRLWRPEDNRIKSLRKGKGGGRICCHGLKL